MKNFISNLECTRCDNRYPVNVSRTICDCGSPLFVRYDLNAIRESIDLKKMAARPTSLWRYRELLPIQSEDAIVSLGEGYSPLIRMPKLAKKIGINEVYIKNEGINPTGTFKDRGASVAISCWKELGIRQFCQPTVGSGGHSWSAYGARADVEVFTALPSDCPEMGWKGAYIHGGHVFLIDGEIADVFRMLKDAAERNNWLNAGALREPFRVEGKKTMGIEIAEQLGWELPDAIFYPTGGGVGLIGMWKVFQEIEELGWISSNRPRMVSVQSTGGSVVKAFHEGKEECEIRPNLPTIAPGIMVLKPFADFLILRTLRESDGWAVEVSENEIKEFMFWVAKNEGLMISPEGAATIAGASKMVTEGQLDKKSRVVLFNTATGLRYPHLIEAKLPVYPSSAEIAVEA